MIMYFPAPQATLFGASPAARSDADGAYVLEGVPVGPGQVMAQHNPGKAFANPISIEVTSTEDKILDIALDLSGEVMGTVVDETGAPVAGVYMRLDRADGVRDMCEAMTDAKGEFDCTLLVGGDYRATVTPSPGARQGFAPAVGDQHPIIPVPSAGAITGIRLAIKNERLAIRGTVVDDTGVPMPDVHVEAVGRGDSSMDASSTLSDTGGRFEIPNLARGAYTLHAHAADGSESTALDVAAGTTSASIKVARAGAIEGTLTGFAASATVFVFSTTGSFGARAMVDGTTFSRIGVPPGRYMVEAMGGAGADAQSIEIQPGKTTRIDLRGRGVGRIEGTVLDLATRKPIAGMRCDAKISLDGRTSPAPPDVSYQAFTDANGRFVVTAPIGRVRIFCFSMTGDGTSPAGTDVDVTAAAAAKVTVFSVRGTFGNAGSDAGFMLEPLVLPLTVGQVAPAGPAAAAGLRAGDQLVTLDGASLQGVLPEGAQMLLMNHPPGVVALGISRGGVAQTVKIAVVKPQ
jgi:hypothetical protein